MRRPSRPAPPAGLSRRLALLGALLAIGPGALDGQEDEGGPVALTVAPATGALTVHLGDILTQGGLRRTLSQGLPVRIQVTTELWRDRLFDSHEGEVEWRATVIQNPLTEGYRVQTWGPDLLEVEVPDLDAAGAALQRALQVPLRPRSEGSWYYLVEVEVETLSLSDLEELQRWLRGDLAPAVAGEAEVESAVARGMRRIVVRVLGLPARRYRVRTPSFPVDPGGDSR